MHIFMSFVGPVSSTSPSPTCSITLDTNCHHDRLIPNVTTNVAINQFKNHCNIDHCYLHMMKKFEASA